LNRETRGKYHEGNSEQLKAASCKKRLFHLLQGIAVPGALGIAQHLTIGPLREGTLPEGGEAFAHLVIALPAAGMVGMGIGELQQNPQGAVQ